MDSFILRRAATLAAWCVAMAALSTQVIHAQNGNKTMPLRAVDFKRASLHGFGDRNNSWAQAMIWWKGNLYVGTGKNAQCTSLYALWQYVALFYSKTIADTYLPYPPPDPDLSCAPQGFDLSIQAEIHRWSPTTETWTRVFQSPLDLDNPGPGAGYPAIPGKKLPYEITIRGFAPFVEADGTQALYAFGVNSTIMWDRTKLPPPRILRTTDGVNWAPVPQAPGTFLGELPFNPDHSSFRSPVAINGKMFVLSGPVFGQGHLIASSDPRQGNNAWFLAGPADKQFYELAAFNGYLYIGGIDSSGYSVYKMNPNGPPPYQLIPIVTNGAYLPNRPSRSVVSMQVYNGRLHVGTATQTEVIRINPDDTWDLVVGPPRLAPLPGGGSEMKYPTSGLDAGFGHTLNDHAWQMDDPYNYLYIGTYNAATSSRFVQPYAPLLQAHMGAHLYRTADDWYYSFITTNGFASPSDPQGGKFDYGIRTMASTPSGFFLGTTNDYYGLMIFRAPNNSYADVYPPERVNVEPTPAGAALLSWLKVSGSKNYRIWRTEINPVFVRDDANFEGWNGVGGNKIPDTAIGPYVLIGQTSALSYVDNTVQPGKRYMYYIDADTQKGQTSDPSNLVTFPLLTPPMTFARLLAEVDKIEARNRYSDPLVKMSVVRTNLLLARTAAAECRLKDAANLIIPDSIKNAALNPELIDLDMMSSQLDRRIELKMQFPQLVISSEFCNGL